MKKRLLTRIAALSISVIMIISLCGCGQNKASNIAECFNGNFVGAYEEETGILSFKGIPYAKAPEGELRWKAPVSAEESSETYSALEFGDSSIQYNWFSEPIETKVSENCLTLNVWTKDLNEKDKTVMVFFHGGSYAWGGSSEDIYNGQYIVNEHNDVVVVTVNFRIGMMGFIDFSDVPGGENFPDSRELGLLDCVEALKWIKENISTFGGNPDNVTIFGESSGAGIVSCLLASDYAGELFNRVISQSGNLRLTYTDEQYSESYMTEALLAVSGAETMDDLMALSTEKLIEINETPLDEDETTINDLYNFPLVGGKVVKENPYDALTNAAEKGVDLLIGTNADEQNYWVEEMGEKPIKQLAEDEIEANLYIFENYYIASGYETLTGECSDEEKANAEEFLASREEEDIWAKSKLLTETVYQLPAIKMAECHSSSGEGKTYMYLFEKKNDNADFLGSCHAVDLPYVFHNLNSTAYGTVDKALADKVCSAWVNFAKTGCPDSEDFKWEEYDTSNRYTTVIGDDNTFRTESDPEKTARELLGWVVSKPMYGAGA